MRRLPLRSLFLASFYARLTSIATASDDDSASPPSPSRWTLVETFTTVPVPWQGSEGVRLPSPNNPYFANDSLLGHPVRCSDEEKACLRLNRILFPADGKCYPLGDGPAHCRFAVDRCLFEREGGREARIRGICAPTDLCRYSIQDVHRMAFDGSCVKPLNLYAVCGPGPVNVVQHFFGDSECQSPRETLTPDLLYVPQPEVSGQCVFPNLRVDVTSVAVQESRVLYRKCSRADAACFQQNKVFCGDVRRCCDLLRRGHCAGADEWVALNRSAWAREGRVEAECVRRNTCSRAKARLMAFDRRCHDAADVLRRMCPGGVLLPNAFGERSCVTRDFYKHFVRLGSRLLGREEVLCEVQHLLSYDQNTPGVLLETDCGLRDDEDCISGYQ